jgi:hypothetical protein
MATFSNIFEGKKGEKEINEMYCEVCDFKCCKKYNWDRHLLTLKHQKATNSNKIATQKEQKEQKETEHICENCNREYKDRTGLWRHKKKCVSNEVIDEIKNISQITPELVLMLIQQNKETQNMMFEIVKNGK